MIITCQKCSTSFNLDDSIVKEDGSKVRCSVCKDIFTAYPLPIESEPEPEELLDLNLESDLEDGDIFEKPSDFEMEDSGLSLEEDSELEMETSDFEDDDDFSFEESELEIEETDDVQELEFEDGNIEFEDSGFGDSEEDLEEIEFETIEDDDIDRKAPDEPVLEDTSADENEFELEFDVEDDAEDLVTDIPDVPSDGIPLELETEPDKEDVSLSLEESDPGDDAEPVAISSESDFSGYDEVLEQDTEPEDDSLEEETIEIEDIQEKKPPPSVRPEPAMGIPPRSRRRKKKSLIGAPVLVILLVFLLVTGAYIASVMTGYKIPYLSDIKIPVIEQYLGKSAPEKTEIKPVPNQKSVNGRFVTNSGAGALFVITGRVENPSDTTAYSHIEIRGALITKGKKEARTKNVFCGNIITEEMLKTGNITDMNKLLSVKTGNHNLNVNIKPGASVPFMVVFSDLPEKLQNFTVKVIHFEKAKSN